MRKRLSLLVLALVTGCDGGVNSGPLAFGIISGGEQTVPVASEQLEPVVGKLVRTADGGITFRLVTPAYAQTVVQGSPVPGAPVCPQVIPGGPIPWTACVLTGDDGTVPIWFSAGTKAGLHPVEIRGTLDGEPAVFDTAYITQEPGALAAWTGGLATVAEGDTIAILSLPMTARDEYHNAIEPDSLAALPVQWVWQAWHLEYPDSPPPGAESGWTTVVPDSASTWGRMDSEPDAALVVWIDGVRSGYSLNVQP